MVTANEELSTALFAGLVMVTLGGLFAAATVTLTTLDVVASPRLSTATAVNECAPVARLAVIVNGALLVPPKAATPSKNVTFVTVPSGSDAVATMVTLAGGVNACPFVGVVMLTAGARLPTGAVDRW